MNDSCTMYVVGIPLSMNSAGLRNMFSRCGDVLSVSILPPKASFTASVGFVDYGSRMEGLKAIQMFDNFKIGDSTLKVSIAIKKNRETHPNLNDLKIDLSTIVERNIEESSKRAAERFKNSVSINERNDRFPCAVCKKLCQAACMSCKAVHYCGSSCQKEDWPRHKMECKELCRRRSGHVDTIVTDKNVSEKDFDVTVDDVLVNELASHVKSSIDIKTSTSLTSVGIPFSIKTGMNLQVQLIDLGLSGDIFCMVPTEETALSELDALHSYYSNESSERPPVVEAGGYYACQFSGDKQWYRACVLDIAEDESTCSVWFVDYGNCEDTESVNLRILTKQFASVPMRTIRCRLDGCDKVTNLCIRDCLMEELSDPVVEIKVLRILGTTAYVQMYGMVSEKLCSVNELVMQRYVPADGHISSKEKFDIKESPKTKKIVCPETPPPSIAGFIPNLGTESGVSPPSSASLPSLTAENLSNLSTLPCVRAADLSNLSTVTHVPAAVSLSNPPTVSVLVPSTGSVSNLTTLPPDNLTNTIKQNLAMEPICDFKMVETNLPHNTMNVTLENKSPSKLLSVFNKIRAKAFGSTQKVFLQELHIPTGKFQAVITHVAGIEELYLSAISEQSRLHQFQHDLTVACDKDFTLQPFMQSTICAYMDNASGKCHRGKILAQDGEAKMQIHFIDSGHKQTVSCSKVGKLPAKDQFWVSPKAIPCKLKGCSNGCDEYNQECIDLLKQCENEPVTAEITGESVDGVYPVTVYMEDSVTVNWCINKLREEFECKDFAIPEKCQVEEAVRPNHSENSCISQHSINDVELKPGVVPVYNDKSDSQITNAAINAISPPVGVEVDLVVVHVVSPSEFYCQVIADELKEVLVQMSQLNNGVMKLKELDVFGIGQMCIACASDNQLYRAEITSVGNKSCDVRFLDYGNSELVSREKIRQIPQDLIKLNTQAVKCRLHDCVPVDDNWSQDCVEAVKGLNDQAIKAMFTGQCLDGHHGVTLILGDGIDVLSILVDQSMAKRGMGHSLDNNNVADVQVNLDNEEAETTLPEETDSHGSANQDFKVQLLSKSVL